jgi:hypothetical protein
MVPGEFILNFRDEDPENRIPSEIVRPPMNILRALAVSVQQSAMSKCGAGQLKGAHGPGLDELAISC